MVERPLEVNNLIDKLEQKKTTEKNNGQIDAIDFVSNDKTKATNKEKKDGKVTPLPRRNPYLLCENNGGNNAEIGRINKMFTLESKNKFAANGDEGN